MTKENCIFILHWEWFQYEYTGINNMPDNKWVERWVFIEEAIMTIKDCL